LPLTDHFTRILELAKRDAGVFVAPLEILGEVKVDVLAMLEPEFRATRQDNRQQRFRPYVWDNGSDNLPDPLKQAEYGHFPGCTSTSLSFANSSEVTFIRFDCPAQFATGKLACNETTKTHEKTGCGAANGRQRFRRST
jgi:hypothetical protein